MLDRLFSVLPRPLDDAMPHWVEVAAAFPPWALESGIAALVRTYRWGRPPLPGDLVTAIESDPAFVRRRTMLARLRSAEMKQRQDGAAVLALPAAAATRAIDGPVRQATRALTARPREVTAAEFAAQRAAVLRQCEEAGMLEPAP